MTNIPTTLSPQPQSLERTYDYNHIDKPEYSIPLVEGLLEYFDSPGIRMGVYCTDQSARDLTGYGIIVEGARRGFQVQVGDHRHDVTAYYAIPPPFDGPSVLFSKLKAGTKPSSCLLELVWYADTPQGSSRFILRLGPTRDFPSDGNQSLTQEVNGSAVSVGFLNHCHRDNIRELIDNNEAARQEQARRIAEEAAPNVSRVVFGSSEQSAQHLEQGVVTSNAGRVAVNA